MPVELAGITLAHLTQVSVTEGARIVHHPVPGMSGDLAQTLGRASVAVQFQGIFYGPQAAEELGQLRTAYLTHQPVDFFTEAVGEGYFSQVLISHIEVNQSVGFPDQFAFQCRVLEYVEPPEPIAADPFGGLNADILNEASAFMDDVQNTLEQVSQLTDLIANFPNFGDPTTQLGDMPNEYTGVVGDGTSTLSNVRDLF